ncbi:MAG: peptidylprolyl isomerase, partial [Bilophila wadsworthia]
LPFGSKVLQARLCQTPVPASQLFFKGENGFNMAPSGSRVLIVPPRKKKSGCCGKCAHCTCHGEHGHGHGGCACRGEHNHDH